MRKPLCCVSLLPEKLRVEHACADNVLDSFYKEFTMDENDQELDNEQEEAKNPHLRCDPAGETKQKLLFFIGAVVVLVVLKVVFGW